MRLPTCSRSGGSAREIGDGGRNGVETRAKSVGQAADRNLRVEERPVRRRIDESRRGIRRQKPAEPRRTNESHIDAGRGHQRQIAEELDRVAEAMIVEHQHALRIRPGPFQVAKRVPSASAERLSLKPARLVAFEARVRSRRASACRQPLPATASRLPSAAAASNAARASEKSAKTPQRQRLAEKRLGAGKAPQRSPGDRPQAPPRCDRA